MVVALPPQRDALAALAAGKLLGRALLFPWKEKNKKIIFTFLNGGHLVKLDEATRLYSNFIPFPISIRTVAIL